MDPNRIVAVDVMGGRRSSTIYFCNSLPMVGPRFRFLRSSSPPSAPHTPPLPADLAKHGGEGDVTMEHTHEHLNQRTRVVAPCGRALLRSSELNCMDASLELMIKKKLPSNAIYFSLCAFEGLIERCVGSERAGASTRDPACG